MRKSIVAGNWKMNGNRQSIETLVHTIEQNLEANNMGVEAIVFPPHVYVSSVKQLLSNSAVKLGAQDVSTHDDGAYTGEVSSKMLRDVGCDYVLVGHSERRAYFSENNFEVAKKFHQAQAQQLIPVLCVGETLEQRQAGQVMDVIHAQLDAVIEFSEAGVEKFTRAVVAYEPVWAIGTGETATPEQAQDVHAKIRARIAEHSVDIADRLSILYGGSVKPSNARALFAMPDIDGGLVGGASLDAKQFVEIYQCTK